MTISGFTIVKNATKLYYPVKAAITSILPLVDEFVVVLGKGDAGDDTLAEIEQIQSDKIRIIHTEWDIAGYPNGAEYARQTDIAKAACKGDWLFYIQSDEVVHEKDLPVIRKKCEELLDDKEVEGLLFDYKHFWGDYSHYVRSHAWYSNEIRIIRNDPEIHSWRDAQSFRRIPDFDGRSYFQKKHTYKLKVARADASIYHYGWVRPPVYMQSKRISFTEDTKGAEQAALFRKEDNVFDYGNLSKLCVFKETHPVVMNDFIKKFDWQHLLYPKRIGKAKHKHDKLKYRVLSWLEKHLSGGTHIGGFKNYTVIR